MNYHEQSARYHVGLLIASTVWATASVIWTVAAIQVQSEIGAGIAIISALIGFYLAFRHKSKAIYHIKRI